MDLMLHSNRYPWYDILRKRWNPIAQKLCRGFYAITSFSGGIFEGYADVFFLQGQTTGVAILLLTLVNPNVSIAGIIVLLPVYLFTRLSVTTESLSSRCYLYNTLLVGLTFGYIYRITPLSLYFLLLWAALAVAVTAAMNTLLGRYVRVPVLTVPFVMVSFLLFFLSRCSPATLSLAVYSPAPGNLVLPFWIHGYFTSLGAVFFCPHVLTGAGVALLILYLSLIHI